MCGGVSCIVDLSCPSDQLHARVAMVMISVIYVTQYLCHMIISRLFSFNNERRGTIEFKGNMLFTHFSEINPPKISSPTGPVTLEMNRPSIGEFVDETSDSRKL